jgi:hypothetical protein
MLVNAELLKPMKFNPNECFLGISKEWNLNPTNICASTVHVLIWRGQCTCVYFSEFLACDASV